MASGVKVDDAVKDFYNKMKVRKNDDDENERVRLAILHIDGSCITVEKSFTNKNLAELEVDNVYRFFLNQLDASKCRYILYDCHFETKESGKKEELVFVMWAPDTAPVKDKMWYASSRQSLKGVLTGLKHEIQANEPSDCDRAAFVDILAKDILNLEGHQV